MKAIKRITALALCALMLLGLLSGCGEKKQGDEKFVLNASVCNVIDSLDPAMNTDTDADSVFYALYENLMRESDDGSGEVMLTNGMAKEYTEETNYDGTVTYRFTLRSTARWSDGEKVTADDFVYAWQRLADPATNSPNHSLMSVVAGYDEVRETGNKAKLQVSAKDKSTFVVTLSAPCAYFIEGICTAVATMPLRRDLTEDGAGFDMPNVVSNGAYHVSAWSKSSKLTAVRNEEYYEARLVGPDELGFVFASGSEETWKLYEAGDIDYIAHHQAGFGIIALQYAFDRDGQFVDQRRVHKFGPGGMEARLSELIRFIVARYHAHIVARRNMIGISHADGKCLAGKNVGGGLVAGADAHGQLLIVADPAPGRIHGVRRAILSIGGEDKDRLRIGPGLCSKILAHKTDLLLCFDLAGLGWED